MANNITLPPPPKASASQLQIVLEDFSVRFAAVESAVNNMGEALRLLQHEVARLHEHDRDEHFEPRVARVIAKR